MTDLPKPDYARNMRIIGHSDQGGRPDGVQIMVHRGYAYVGHMFSKGFSVIDVRHEVACLMDHRPNRAHVIQSTDVFVDKSGLIYSADYNAGLSALEYGGGRLGFKARRPFCSWSAFFLPVAALCLLVS